MKGKSFRCQRTLEIGRREIQSLERRRGEGGGRGRSASTPGTDAVDHLAAAEKKKKEDIPCLNEQKGCHPRETYLRICSTFQKRGKRGSAALNILYAKGCRRQRIIKAKGIVSKGRSDFQPEKGGRSLSRGRGGHFNSQKK